MKSGCSYIEHKSKQKSFIVDNNLKDRLDLTSDIILKARISLGYSDKTISLDIRRGLLNHILKLKEL